MQKVKPVLSVVVVYGTDKGRTVTRISVRVGGVEVAWKTVGLKWSQTDAMKEWKLNRRTFTMAEHAETLLAMAA
jgi:hypothetical protein